MKTRALKFKDLETLITAVEGGKSQVKRADVIEILSKLSMVLAKEPRAIECLLANGRKKWARKK